MKVLSLFDGMSCTRIALDKLDIKLDSYYASEVDKYAIKVSQANYPSINQLGDVTKWRTWDIDWSTIDLVVAGFPCQSWSLAGQGLGDKDKRGQLFWTTLDIIKHVLKNNPKANYLMENVKMKKDFEDYITYHTEQALGTVQKYLINSSLVSAQNRKRFYWTNILNVNQPKDRGSVLADILEDGVTDRGKSHCLDANYFKGGNLKSYFEKRRRQLVFNKETTSPIRDKSKTVRSGGRGSYDRHEWDSVDKLHWRKLTPLECERLQTVPDNYTNHVSNTQRYKMLGNGFTVDVISHILKHI